MKGKSSWTIIRISAAACAAILFCIVAFLGISALLQHLSGTSFNFVPQAVYKMSYSTFEVAGLVVRDKADEHYEYEATFVFEDRTEHGGHMDFTFLWDVVEGFDENAVAFDKPGVAYEVDGIEDGWRRLTIRCDGLDVGEELVATLRYPAEKLAVRETVPGYYKWDLETYTEEAIPELDVKMGSHENPYACANWIKRNIEYENRNEGPQSAAETFRLGKGDCDDVAILFCYMIQQRFPEMTPRIVEGWSEGGRYHANVAIRTDAGWLMLDPSMSSTQFGVFDFKAFVPSGHASVPFHITDAEGSKIAQGGIGISFGSGNVREVEAEA